MKTNNDLTFLSRGVETDFPEERMGFLLVEMHLSAMSMHISTIGGIFVFRGFKTSAIAQSGNSCL